MQTALQKRCIERSRKNFLETYGFLFATEIRKSKLHVSTELPQYLTTGATRRRQSIRIRNYGNPLRFQAAFRDRFENRHSFGAHRESIRRVLDVAAGVNPPLIVFKSRPHFKSRKRRMRPLTRLPGRIDERLHRFLQAPLLAFALIAEKNRP